MELLKKNKYKIALLFISSFVFLLFAYITKLTPVAGDDWGYAILGRQHNPIIHAFKFYFHWSGRYFSELWGFVVAPRKWLWNILNPIIFTVMYVSIINLIKPKKNILLVMFIVLALMLSVQNTLRIETYTWIMGSTYVVPLMVMLLYLNVIKPVILYDKPLTKLKLALSIFLNIYVTLCMENIAAVLVLANMLMLAYLYFNNKKLMKKFSFILAFSIIGLVVLRLSPGSNYRLYRDNQDWITMSLFAKIVYNWKLFINLTFIKNSFMLLGLGTTLTLLNLKVKNKKIKYILLFISLTTVGLSMLPLIYNIKNIEILRIFFDITYSRTALVFTSVFYLTLVVSIFVSIWLTLEKDEALEASLYVMLAGSANIVMMISPIFGDRSSLYTVYFIFIFSAFILSIIDINTKAIYAIIVCSLLTIALCTKEYLFKYKAINKYQQIRNAEIEYYVDHYYEKEAWLIRMPLGYMHSADIDEGDDYHMGVFKAYYGLNPYIKLIFYNK